VTFSLLRSSALLSLAWLGACASARAAEPAPTVAIQAPFSEQTQAEELPPQGRCGVPRPARATRSVTELASSPGDPLAGRFDLEMATVGLAGDYPLEAMIATNHGRLECELWEHVAPRTVASFVGLARGLRPFQDPRDLAWKTARFYDGLTFHRVIPGFMIQGGDPMGTGTGEPGFNLPDEIDESVRAERPGLLYMANRGPDTNGSQFFILDGAAPHLDGRYTAFGECAPSDVIKRIANVPTAAGNRPIEPVLIDRVEVAFSRKCD
jgi:peptidyl-prolyl cis-trans isomerase A (cyclophilin A)